ncbi:MAG TPA: GTP 3',8-cyclase MoaA [Polyangia bacterium]|jgi:cyclic pyranopterin phosphate synthase|nr:GTP 3',8-cyclase MoaA [Polyangia bacterium]
MAIAIRPDSDASPADALIDPQQRRIEYLRLSVTDRCNYRCTYCIPEGGVEHVERDSVLSFEEITRLAACFARLGVRRLRLTGGEPTVRRDLPRLVAMLRALPGIEDLALSTNGHRLAELAAPLREAGVDRLNVSVDSLDPERFARITRGGTLARVLDGLEAARAAGFTRIKLNAVAVRGFNDDEVPAICAYAWERGMVPRFIEQMPMADGALFVPGTFMSAREIRDAVARAYPGARLTPEAPSRAAGAGPARYVRVELAAGGVQRFGVISAMTEHFCDTCNRLRLSASGALHTCLGHDDATDLRAILRTRGEDATVDAIRAAVRGKRDGHTFGLIGIGGPRKAMVQIGG